MAKRILRLTASPHAIAAGVAAGVFASFTPFLGFHFVIAFIVSYVVAGNFLAAALGTFFGNPFTFPFIWASTFATGRFILTGDSEPLARTNALHDRLGEIGHTDVIALGMGALLEKTARLWDPVIRPMMIGAIPLGIVSGIIAYILTRWIAIGFRAARKKRLATKALAQQRRNMSSTPAVASESGPPRHEGKADAAASMPASGTAKQPMFADAESDGSRETLPETADGSR